MHLIEIDGLLIMILSRQKSLMFLLSGLMVLSCYQIYLFRIAGSYIPISALFMAMCIPFVKVLKLKDPLVVLFSMSLLLNAISILWSPVIGLWEYQMVFGYIFLITYAAFKEIQDTELAGKLIKLFLMASAVNGVLIVIFRLRPEIEAVFILNFLNFFKNPDRLGKVRISTLRNENETFSQLNSITYIGVFLRLVTYSHLP